ncbi:transmembrane GTPase Marf [Eurytemora carolleeae]|uniref:transmembrane GTPase Marf n=1 Tax=Eurytemora carolleeae TaxID=1294199 RepID=UPI000C76514B|nr:transmembrane GTPase Marf [Eurytemora carolleeae]|eukprot:XP_023348232.1 transmembrane GTPase Marf-like [Eurytemora affinis]
MSGSISRSVSLLSPEDGVGLAGGLPASNPRGDSGFVNPANSPSPLQHFVQAKKKINEVFREMEQYIHETERFLDTVPEDILEPDVLKKALEFSGKVNGIREVLERDHMKVAFFGRTSNGKSTAINSLLGEKILPTGIGHTTSCFLQVEGSQTGEAYLTTEGSGEHKSLTSLSQLGNALSTETLEHNSQVRIHWPVEKCRLLGEEVVIIDSPGIDVEADLDNWIDRFCLDSDVFVLVSNGESTIMNTEKRFFHKVSERLSNPNLFIVHNRWDCSAGEDCQEDVRKQHTNRAVQFLTQELEICTKDEAADRIFFISAKEALQTRLQKLKSHISGKIMSLVQETSSKAKQAEEIMKKELLHRLDFTERELEFMTLEMKDKICAIVEDVEWKSGRLIYPFHPDPLVVNVYKSKLNHYVESGVGSNLKSRLSSDLSQNMETQQKEMMDRMTALLPPEKQTVSRNILPRREAFEVLYHLNCENLCADFQEDLSFRFSLGFSSVLNRFLSSKQTKRTPRSPGGIPRGLPLLTPDTPSNEFFVPQDDWSLLSKLAIASISSQGTMGGLLVGGLLFKTVGWRVLAVTGLVYGTVYAYERMTWTNQARMRLFKKQYVEHAARQLKRIVDMTSSNCSHQVQQELSSTFARLCHMVIIYLYIKEKFFVTGKSKVLRNESSFLANKLDMFKNSFLNSI